MRLYPLPQSKLENIRPILEASRVELNMTERGDVEVGLERIEAGYIGQYMGVYVDNIENPKHCTVIANWPGIVTRDSIAAVILIYSVPEERGNKEALAALLTTVENFARYHGAGCILGSSWQFRGARPIDVMWLANGYELQETTYVKILS